MPCLNKTMKKELKGITLIELLVAITIVSIIIVVMYLFGNDLSKKSSSLSSDMVLQEEVTRTFRELNKELKGMQMSDTGAYNILSASTSSLSFYFDTDDNGTPEQIRYFLTNNQVFKRGIIFATGTPPVYLSGNEKITEKIHNVQNTAIDPIFKYYDSSYPATSTPMFPIQISNIKVINVSITAKQIGGLGMPISVSATHTIRSLKSN